eukprot:4470524-Prymnesium_polylepis.2
MGALIGILGHRGVCADCGAAFFSNAARVEVDCRARGCSQSRYSTRTMYMCVHTHPRPRVQ